MTNITKIYLLYFFLFLGAIIFPLHATLFFFLIVVSNMIIALCTKNIDVAIYSSTLLGSELLCIINILLCLTIYIIKRKHIPAISLKGSKEILTGIVIIACSSLVNGIISGTVINAVFYFAYIFLLFLSYRISRDAIDFARLNEIVKRSIILEFCITITLFLINKTLVPGDWYYGTISNAHYLGNWCILTLVFYLTTCLKQSGKTISLNQCVKHHNLSYIAMLLFMLYFADAKGIVLSAIWAVFFYLIINIFVKYRYNLFAAIIGFYIMAGLILLGLRLPIVQAAFEQALPSLSVYVYKPGWNGKYLYMYGTFFESLSGIRLFFGYGLGQFGSRIANAFAYDSMWRSNKGINNLIASLFNPSHNAEYVKYISYFDQTFVNGIGWRSAVLSYPFSSFFALLGETGIFGVYIFAKCINKVFQEAKGTAKFLIVYYFFICFFDIYFDDFQCVLPFIIYLTAIYFLDSRQTSCPKRLIKYHEK